MNIIKIDKNTHSIDKKALISSFLNGKELELEFVYGSDFKNTKDLRDFIEVICDILELGEKNKSRFILIADEFNNNAIEYGTKIGGTNKLRIITKEKNDGINFSLEVEDEGNGRAPKKAIDLETMRAHKLKRGYFSHKSIRGRGLFLITVQIVDRLYFKDSKDEGRGLIVGIKTKLK